MARSLNKVTLIGNVGSDPEIRTTQGGGKDNYNELTFDDTMGKELVNFQAEKDHKASMDRLVRSQFASPFDMA